MLKFVLLKLTNHCVSSNFDNFDENVDFSFFNRKRNWYGSQFQNPCSSSLLDYWCALRYQKSRSSALLYRIVHVGGKNPGSPGDKNGPFLGRLVENDDHKYAWGKPFENFGKIRIFVRFRIRGQTSSPPKRSWAHIAYTGPLKSVISG